MKEQDERIERLLECYFDARTTEAEERELRDYFRYVDEIPASLRYARTMFGGLDALAEERYPGEGSVQTGPAVRPAEGMRRYETRSAAGRQIPYNNSIVQARTAPLFMKTVNLP